MNRLVIIGNGFDLAHGLPTSYRDFIDDFWKNFRDKCKTEEYKELVYTHEKHEKYYSEYKVIEKFDDLLLNIKQYLNENPEYYFDEGSLKFYSGRLSSREKIFEFKNDFFKRIVQKNSENWVDIENEYYLLLKFYVNSKNSSSKEKKVIVSRLNSEFNQLKHLLEKYLNENIENKFLLDLPKEFNVVNDDLYKVLRPISVFNNETNLKLEFNNLEDKNDIDIFFNKEKHDSYQNKSEIRLLNFNYTSTLNRYIISLVEGRIKVELNHIHGKLNNNLNLINFGFGDEMDEDYKAIENINDNEYLKNFKSFQYLQNSNYSDLLSYIDSEKFQVLIMGHSCGLSDRTLLNTIFEHHNCRSIKIFYHLKEDKNDNYTEITQNISRHFNKKKLMREKIVNKTLCQPLPQIQLPKFKMVNGMPIAVNN
ncbi:AbiH family protein [Flavobacterium terrigena]|nr:AbiH family protein [Flavobacterium terrigena]